jgi:hypothetical protein
MDKHEHLAMYIHTIDITHPPLVPDDAEQAIDEAIDIIRLTQKWRTLKIIHGCGTQERLGALKQVVQNWASRNQKHFLAVIPGEEYHISNTLTQEMRKVCGKVPDTDLDANNPGVTLIWIK